jgi:peptide/nickel transport system substrate-binding protein
LIASSISWGVLYYYSHTKPVATYGGEYTEGIIGQPLHINPLISQSNATDEDLTQLIYSRLFKYDGQGKITNDLAESYTLSKDKTTYTIHLRKNVLWQDGQPFKAEDVLFTLNLISDPTYKSPLRTNWQGIKSKVLDDYTIEFKIDTPYVGFLNNLTFGILPKHIWESITPTNFSLNSLNLEPIGTGPYKFNSIQKDKKGNIISYSLNANPTYFAGKPYINKLTFKFYTDENTAIEALNKKEIMGINAISPQNSHLLNKENVLLHKLEIPRYFAVFLNQTKSIPLSNDEVRQALAYATNRQEIINQVLDGNGQPVYSPFLPNMIGYSDKLAFSKFDLAKANKILTNKGWKKGTDGFRGKDGVGLTINLVTVNWPELVKTATLLKNQWEKVGIRVNTATYSLSDIRQNYIRPREYEALLFGQVIGNNPDPYSFWYSSQKKDPGLNLSLFGDDDSDRLIADGRVEFDSQKRNKDYVDFQKILLKENPAIFLYAPKYLYPVNRNIKGIKIKNIISPANRFTDITHWYLKTKRVKK